jgi:hypothetical protein
MRDPRCSAALMSVVFALHAIIIACLDLPSLCRHQPAGRPNVHPSLRFLLYHFDATKEKGSVVTPIKVCGTACRNRQLTPN